MFRSVLWVFIATSCVQSGAKICDFGLTCPEDSMCDPVHQACATQEQMDACANSGDGSSCMITVPDDGVCDASICIPARCGDGYLTGGEACDGASFAAVSNCQQLGYYDDKPIGCTETCELEEAVCTGLCGDGQINGEELCDGADPTTQTCLGLGFGTGVLHCSTLCGPRLSSCVPFGWKRVDMPAEVVSVHALSSSSVWAAGGAAMVRHYDGSAWSTVDASGCAMPDERFTRVFGVSATEAWVHIDGVGVGLVTATGCTMFPTSESFNTLWAPSATELYAGDDNGLFHLQGGTWTTVDTLPTQVVWGSGATDIYATTDDINDDAVDGMIRHFDGATWSAPGTISGIHKITALWGSSASNVYVAGNDSSPKPVVLHKNGLGWVNVFDTTALVPAASIPFLGASAGSREYLRMIDLASGNNALASRGPAGWALIPAPFDAQQMSGTAEGAVYAAAPGAMYLYVLDGGVLAPMETPTGRLTDIAANRTDRAIAVASPAGFFASPALWAWDGSAWTDESFSSVRDVTVIGGELYAIAGGTIRRFDGPANWPTIDTVGGGYGLTGLSGSELWYANLANAVHRTPSVTTQTVLSFPIRDLWQASTTFIVAVGLDGHIAHYNGSTWTDVTSPTTGTLTNVWGRSATEVYAWSPFKVLRYDGTSWTVFYEPGATITGVWSGGPDDVFVTSAAGVSHWDGMGWSPVDSGSAFGAHAITGVGDALMIGNADSATQLFRLRPW